MYACALLTIVLLLFAGCAYYDNPAAGHEFQGMEQNDTSLNASVDSDLHSLAGIVNAPCSGDLADYASTYDENNIFCGEVLCSVPEHLLVQDECLYVERISLSLGDTFQFGDFEVTFGDRIEFVLYAQVRYLYIPVSITDTRVEPEFLGATIWQLTDSTYYRPGEMYPNHASWRNPGFEESASLFSWRNPSARVETHARLLYNTDGAYTLQFNLREWSESEFYFRIISIFELFIDAVWPTDYTTITIEHILLKWLSP